MKYTYEDMPDKSIEGIRKEVKEGLVTIGMYFFTTHGMPIELFAEEWNKRNPTNAEAMLLYMDFRNKHPNLFKQCKQKI